MKLWLLSPFSSFRFARTGAFSAPNDGSLRSFNELYDLAKTYLRPGQLSLLRQAYDFGAQAHAEQRRISGEPYIEHPIGVAKVLAEMRMDLETLLGAMLHDVLEDTPVTKDKLAETFGAEVANLVDGVSKLTQMEFESYAEAQAENFRKMLMAMTSDIRVILVKLADRLHNMRTLGALPLRKRRLIARETLDIYAPIAFRLGINTIRLELEDLGFANLYPHHYEVLANEVKKLSGNRKKLVIEIKNAIKRRLRQEKLPGKVMGREKHVYSIYQKMQIKHSTFSEVSDVYGFRIVVENVDSAYRVLGVVHNLFKPVPGKFKDYIAIPKTNGYQSLHTALFGPHGVPIEVQIRTKEMDEVAERGIAAHWLYKTGDNASSTAQLRARDWLRNILEMQKQAGNSEEFLENVKIDLFPDEVYVFTPKGDIIKLPRGSSAVDFAYAVHTDVGNGCVAARIDRRLVPLRTVLTTGHTVEVITAPGASPNPTWLNFVVSGKARAHIRHFLKNLEQGEARDLGKRMLNRELERSSLSVEGLGQDKLQAALAELKLHDIDALFEDIGLGKRLAPIVARYFVPGASDEKPAAVPVSAVSTPLAIKGTEGMVVSFPKCCYPIPGDAILGFVSAGKGIVIHRQTCKNLAEFRNHPEKWVDVEWGGEVSGEFSTEIRVVITNQRGALAMAAAAISEQGVNIELVEMSEQDDRYVTMTFIIQVRDRQHLAQVLRAIRMLKPVSRISRT
jgi:RelA/SpoT family (p)ppGpp synthetase